ncbi:hypothetical protein FNB79_03760 [Formosa sediminum]|uniref:Uncharacterized protein n=1 Tax=Formosa sediminum TaxID=2594004 RepID=A0A516GNM7_9FLAO|nr:DUF6168 family protein [Formosa sediminum]QDO93128.1 hypothetical protein FNB79_03760 [Formosa sediminum]
MIKRILVFLLSIILLFVIAFTIHNYFMTEVMSYKLWHVYLYHFIATLIVYISMEAVLITLPEQVGYTYLALMLIKLGVFVLLFKDTVFKSEQLAQAERYALVVPLLLFLTLEAIAVAKLLNSK